MGHMSSRIILFQTPSFLGFSAGSPVLFAATARSMINLFTVSLLSSTLNFIPFALFELMDLSVAGRDESAEDQAGPIRQNLAEGHPSPIVTFFKHPCAVPDHRHLYQSSIC